MGDMMHTLLEDQRAIERRSAAILAPVVPATRAEKIIAEGYRRMHAFRCSNPDADTTMVFGAQVGFLHGSIKGLCNELDHYSFERDTRLIYERVRCDQLRMDVWVGFTNDYDADCDTHDLQVCEVRCNGADIVEVLTDDIKAALGVAALERFDAKYGAEA